jgi:hypothetical protein
MQHQFDTEETIPQQVEDQLLQELAKRYPSYVLVTAGEPNVEGKLNVQLSYQGDPWLARYLIDGAADVLDEACCEADDEFDSSISHNCQKT